MDHRPRRFGSAHAIAFLALFVALAGGAYAAKLRLLRGAGERNRPIAKIGLCEAYGNAVAQ